MAEKKAFLSACRPGVVGDRSSAWPRPNCAARTRRSNSCCATRWGGAVSAPGIEKRRGDRIGRLTRQPQHATARNCPHATISSSTAAWGIGYVCHSTFQPPSTSARRDSSAHADATTGSCVPCAMKIGMSRFAGVASAARVGRVDEIGRQRHDAGQPLGMAQAGVERDRPALRKSGQHDAPRRHATCYLRARSAPRPAPATCARRPHRRAN